MNTSPAKRRLADTIDPADLYYEFISDVPKQMKSLCKCD